MRRSLAWMFVCSALLVACGGDDRPPPPPLPLSDASFDLDGSIPDGGLPDGMVEGDGGLLPDGGRPPTGDLCTDHLSGISCEVEQIIGLPNAFCARVRDGDVKCWGFGMGYVSGATTPNVGGRPNEMGDNLGFVDMPRPVTQMASSLDADPAFLLDNNQVIGLYGEVRMGDLEKPVHSIHHNEITVALFGDREPVRAELVEISPGVVIWVTVPFETPFVALDYVGVLAAYALSDEHDLWRFPVGGPWGRVSLGGPVTEISSDGYSTCAVLEGGDLKCWGPRTAGLGPVPESFGTYVGDEPGELERLPPIDVGAPVRHVSVGGGTSTIVCAILMNGNLKCWGRNTAGSLGLGTDDIDYGGEVGEIAGSDVVHLGTGRTALQVIAGQTTCALLDDHSVKCWGRNEFGNTGSGDAVARGDQIMEMGDALQRVNIGSETRAELLGPPPIVTVETPLPSTELVPGQIHVGNTLAVVCDVRADVGGSPVDAEEVSVRLINAAGRVVLETDLTLIEGTRFSGTLSGLAQIDSGTYQVECVGATDAGRPQNGRGSVEIFHDSGPLLTFVDPDANAVVGQRAIMHVELTALPGQLTPNDTEADITSVAFSVAGVALPLTPIPSEPGHHAADVDFLSNIFPAAPAGPVTLVLTATNERGQTSTLERIVQVDGTGPVIVVLGTNYDNGDVIRGQQSMLITVTDTPAGVEPGSIYGNIGARMFDFEPTGVANQYLGLFDTREYDLTVSQLTVAIHSFDRVGNESIEPRMLQLDNRAPIASLDSAPVREYKRVGQATQCSTPFDPLGADTVGDGWIVPEGAEFRARIEDQTNGVTSSDPFGGGIVRIFAGVAGNMVDLLVLTDPDLTRPLLIDTNGDQVCDEINNELSGLDTFQTQTLRPISPRGSSLYTVLGSSLPNEDPLWASGCSTPANAPMMGPPLVCAPASDSSLLTRVIKAPLAGSFPAIWGFPGGSDTLACAGHYWDWQLQIPVGGPACVAVRTIDNVGNVGVSPPIRVCFQRSSGAGSYDCAADTSWRDHDCMSGIYENMMVTCDPPPDFAPGYVKAD